MYISLEAYKMVTFEDPAPYKEKINQLKQEIYKLNARLKKREFPHKKYENLKHELRRSCKDPKFTTLAQYRNYIYTTTLK